MKRRCIPFFLVLSILFCLVSSCDKEETSVSSSQGSSLEFTVNGVTFRMIRVGGGTFNMGAQPTDLGSVNYDWEASLYEGPVHSVKLRSYYIGETEVTQGLWTAVMGTGNSTHDPWTSSRGMGSSTSAYNISYNDVQSFITQLNDLTKMNFRMPTEAEWEYAARGGSQSQGYKYSGSNTFSDVGWTGERTHPVATKKANELGIYDMSGNVWEWCSDWYGDYSSGSQSNPMGPSSGDSRVVRGGGGDFYSRDCRVSMRSHCDPDHRLTFNGFRLALSDSDSTEAPKVSTTAVSNITSTTASCGGDVTATGGASVIAKGICWGTSANPAISDSHTTNGTGTGSFTSSITGLSAGTTYYVRAYATNSAGTSYGSQVSFTTEPSDSQTPDFTVNGVTFRMIRVDGGTFNMGAQSTNTSGANYDSEAYSNESPVHSISLGGYFIGETEVTQGLWKAVMGPGGSWHGAWNSSHGLSSNTPVYNISYDDIQSFITQLNSLTGMDFRIPTEAEWEYAARGGNQSQGYKYSGSNTFSDVGWTGERAHPVATKKANELGIYDMSGNVWEWCSDWYGDYSSGSQTNPTGLSSGDNRVIRGGGGDFSFRVCRVSSRSFIIPDHRLTYVGFRLALSE